jgi:hypothetical protein
MTLVTAPRFPSPRSPSAVLGVARNEAWATIAGAACNLVRVAHIELAHTAG